MFDTYWEMTLTGRSGNKMSFANRCEAKVAAIEQSPESRAKLERNRLGKFRSRCSIATDGISRMLRGANRNEEGVADCWWGYKYR